MKRLLFAVLLNTSVAMWAQAQTDISSDPYKINEDELVAMVVAKLERRNLVKSGMMKLVRVERQGHILHWYVYHEPAKFTLIYKCTARTKGVRSRENLEAATRCPIHKRGGEALDFLRRAERLQKAGL